MGYAYRYGAAAGRCHRHRERSRATLVEVIEEVEVRAGALLASRLERFRLVGR